jgi:hypothetical protein
MGLFGSKPAELATNAPRHWRRVPSSALTRGMSEALNSAILSGLVMKGLEEDGIQFTLDPFSSFLYEDGVLRVPAIIQEPNARTAVFAYENADADSARHYSAVRSLLRQREQINAVYYAPGALNPAPGGVVLEPLDVGHFVVDEDERPPLEYALWWPTPEEPLLSTSPALAHLDAWFETLAGYASYLFSAFVSNLQLAGPDAKAKLYGLPDAVTVVPLEGPGGQRLYLNASASDGLWFALDVATPVATRNRLLKLMAGMARDFKATCVTAKVPPYESDAATLAYWRKCRARALEVEGEDGLRIGFTTDVGAKGRYPGATTAAERAQGSLAPAGGPGPSEALAGFAEEQLDAALRIVATRAGKRDDDPNLSPFLAVRVDGRTETVTLHMFTDPEAAERAPVLLAERPAASMAVLACDSIINIGGERTDAVRLRAQERGSDASYEFYQRYRLKDELQLVGNWALSGTAGSLFTATAPEAGEPPAHVWATAEARLADLLKWMTIGDPSGAKMYERRQPLISPCLYTLDGGSWKMSRFVMGNEAWAESASVADCSSAKQAGASVAVFEYDEVLEMDGTEARRFKLRVHHRGDAHSWVFVQPYATPVKGKPFTTVGPMALVRAAEPLLPGPAAAVPAAAPSPAPVAAPRPAAMDPVERRRLELSQSAQNVDLAEVLRFVARRLEIDGESVTVTDKVGAPRRVAWTDLAEAWVRRLPSVAPWANALLVELIPARGAPVRILPSTVANFRSLPGGAAPSRNENLRKVVLLARAAQPSMAADPGTAGWLDGREPQTIVTVKELAEHDVRFP